MPREQAIEAIAARSLTRRYSARCGPLVALDDVSFQIAGGQHVALLGPNGSGKSTLLRLIAGADAPTSGSLDVLGMNPRSAKAARRLGVVFQSPALDPLLTVRENLLLQGALVNMSRPRAVIRADHLAEMFDLTDRLGDRTAKLSGGLRRRADLARALMASPAILLLDEPTVGLDPAARAAFQSTISRLQREEDMTVITSTHLLDEAEFAHRVLLLDRGRLLRDAPPEALRAECGGRLIRASGDEAAALMKTAGLDVREDGGVLLGSHPDRSPGAIARAAAALAERSIDFAVGPPTLSDVYLTLASRRGDPPRAGEKP